MAETITLQQALSLPSVRGAFSRVSTAPQFFQQFFRMRPTDPATISGEGKRTFGYDIYGHALGMAQGRAPKVGPARIAPRPIGSAMITIARSYESIPFDYEDIFGMRGIGTMQLDARGETWVANQKLYLAERQINWQEFMVARMFTAGGFSMSFENESVILGEKGAGSIDVSYPIPTENTGNLDGIISASWDAAGTKIIQQMLAINAVSERTTGYPIRHLFMNSVTYAHLLANTQLQTVRGTAMPIFAGWSEQEIQTTGATRRSGFSVMFPAMPQYTFHVYDGVSRVSHEAEPATRTTANTTKYLADGKVLMTPDPAPGTWHGMATTSEMIRKTGEDAPVEWVEGLDAWSMPKNDPPGEELRVLNNFAPVLFIPGAIFYATVVF